MRRSSYIVLENQPTHICIKDVGPWDKHPSVTNDAENVVQEMVPVLNGRRLFYIDSEGNRDELVIKDGQFAGFAPARQV